MAPTKWIKLLDPLEPLSSSSLVGIEHVVSGPAFPLLSWSLPSDTDVGPVCGAMHASLHGALHMHHSCTKICLPFTLTVFLSVCYHPVRCLQFPKLNVSLVTLYIKVDTV